MQETVLELSARGGRIAAGGGLFAGEPFAAGLIAGGLFASGLNAATRNNWACFVKVVVCSGFNR